MTFCDTKANISTCWSPLGSAEASANTSHLNSHLLIQQALVKLLFTGMALDFMAVVDINHPKMVLQDCQSLGIEIGHVLSRGDWESGHGFLPDCLRRIEKCFNFPTPLRWSH